MPPECASDTDFDAALPAPSPQHPVLVGFCQAFAYCVWAGKRLCGSLDDGGVIQISFASGINSLQRSDGGEWMWACEDGERALAYPYGHDLELGRCAPPQAGSAGQPPSYDGLEPVGSHPACVGGYPGLLDMGGNAVEWIYARAPPLDDGGPMYYAMGATDECRSVAGPVRAVRAPYENAYGIRCCASASP